MPFALPDGWWPLQPADAVLLGYVALQALRGAVRGAAATLTTGLALVLALTSALGAATLPLPLPMDEHAAALGVGIVTFVVIHALSERLIGLVCAPAACLCAALPGGLLAERLGGVVLGALHGLGSAALILALVAQHAAVLPVTQWLDGAPLSTALTDAGSTGLTWLASAGATVMAHLHERWSF